jgi:hypothetical protein
MTQRYRQEAQTLQTLINYDQLLIGQCDLLRSLAADQLPAAIIERLPEMEAGLAAIRSTLQNRQAVLLGPIPR